MFRRLKKKKRNGFTGSRSRGSRQEEFLRNVPKKSIVMSTHVVDYRVFRTRSFRPLFDVDFPILEAVHVEIDLFGQFQHAFDGDPVPFQRFRQPVFDVARFSLVRFSDVAVLQRASNQRRETVSKRKETSIFFFFFFPKTIITESPYTHAQLL